MLLHVTINVTYPNSVILNHTQRFNNDDCDYVTNDGDAYQIPIYEYIKRKAAF